ncbi:6-phosphogluconolactonase [Cellulomonas aerilata]|uniref:6-phosphogluconolactonase n=1 Tax=Cellulomonas aerilata TaxID=515326 RepID=A0A512DG70_9CELL|nr:6-phosphogluconolactonase [Cellulomonas aerilata]GEO35180.1 6-phosphogluconolactonase [Cellulomonas aerilata]
MTRSVVVHPDADLLAQATAARLLLRLLDLQSVRRPVHVVLTGGTVGIKTLAAVADSPLRAAVDWSGVHLWWGDERFLPEGHPDRNETQARQALLDPLGDALPQENVHPMACADGTTLTPDDSAVRYCDELATFADPGTPPGAVAVPAFDVLLLGVGPDGHVASLFPGHEGLEAGGTGAVGVYRCPKPPPERVTLTYDAIHAAREVWLVAAGAEKAAAVGSALAGDPVEKTPAAGAAGTERTLWLLDAAAAGVVEA